MKKIVTLLFTTIVLTACSPGSSGADPNQDPPVLSRENDPYDKHEEQDIAELEGLHINESKAKSDLHQGDLSDKLAAKISEIEDVEYVTVIVHEKLIAAAVTHIGSDVEQHVVNTIKEQVGDGYEIYVSEDKAAYRMAQAVDNGLRAGFDEKWEHENMERLTATMKKAT
ncbi:hypothetical protein E2R51_01545 [Jeotgalibacillus sp. S-D1]|uniref:YhcN/YlaJ family sporulation lipoprotein n=1 Tax=Jeotgalibacillus sp. S-D1 TaxID=2552189 RepID=UPI00105AA8E0|nr:YhcN/YlaJ family sporulation lipoprotein [Jeotgalibacillus sp. S-D1]TDL34426.1 hypothetical protein E2R51_01545 [Jeotgalibacillus sp. S-D1]